MYPKKFEINEDKINENNVVNEFYAIFFLFMLKENCRTSKKFAGPVDPRCYCPYGANYILS